MSNLMKGEIDINLNGEVFTLRPTFDCLVTIEGRLGMTISDIINNFSIGRYDLNTMAVVLWAGVKGYDDRSKLTPKDIGEKLFNHGILTFVTENKDEDGESLLSTFLTFGILGEKEFKKVMEEKEETRKQVDNTLDDSEVTAPPEEDEAKK